MASQTPTSEPGLSPLFRLPREIRDLIYEFALVQGTVHVQCAFVKLSIRSSSPKSDLSESITYLRSKYPCTRQWLHRRLWTVPTFDIDNGGKMSIPGLSTATMTYQLARKSFTGVSRRVNIEARLLQTCKQIYIEGSEIFYQRNVFSFTERFSSAVAFNFLCDRPARSLLMIKSLELGLTEGSNMNGTPLAHYPVLRRATDTLVLQYCYDHFFDLCTLIGTPRMRLRTFRLIIQTIKAFWCPRSINFTEFNQWESKLNEEEPWEPSWIEPLFKIHDLGVLDVFWVSRQPRFRRMIEVVGLLRRHLIEENTQTGARPNHSRNVCTIRSGSDSRNESRIDGARFFLLVNTCHLLDISRRQTIDHADKYQLEISDRNKIAHLNTLKQRPYLIPDFLEPDPVTYICHYSITPRSSSKPGLLHHV